MLDIFEDDRADAIFWRIYKTPDGDYRPERDGKVFEDCLAQIAALGYAEDVGREFLMESVAETDRDD